ncbi:hypothetical protein BGX23_008012 [Mortierella sp. AD031]|nr:hypothetical protein BGX23_008012 [Mortierella sp. AD031]
MAYATIDESILYVQGGAARVIYNNDQFFSLDLTLSWNVSNSPYKILTVGAGSQAAPVEWDHSLTVTKDKKSLVACGSKTGISIYDIAAATWRRERMLIYNPSTFNAMIVPMFPSTVLEFQTRGFSFVWSELRKSFLLFVDPKSSAMRSFTINI